MLADTPNAKFVGDIHDSDLDAKGIFRWFPAYPTVDPVDESNVGSSVRTAGRCLDWLKLREFLAGPNTGRDLIEMADFSFASVRRPQLPRRPTSGHS